MTTTTTTTTTTLRQRAGGPTALPLLLIVLLCFFTSFAAALDQSYCSSMNTGSDGDPQHSNFQSNGLCHDSCGGYAFAIVQGKECWCSNYVPTDQKPLTDCNVQCPGYPPDKCGNEGKGLFGYIPVGSNKPSGTMSGSINPPATTASSTAGPSTVTVVPSSSVDTSSSSSSVSRPSSSSRSSTTDLPTTILLTTVSGSVVTQTVTSNPTPMLPAKSERSAGSTAGIVIGSIAGAALIGALAFMFCWRRRRTREEIQDHEKFSVENRPSRTSSTLRKGGFLSKVYNLNSATPAGSGDSGHSGQSQASPSGLSPISERRNSRPLVYDQRLNPATLVANNASRASLNTLQDNQDYSARILNVRNPDPPTPDGHPLHNGRLG